MSVAASEYEVQSNPLAFEREQEGEYGTTYPSDQAAGVCVQPVELEEVRRKSASHVHRSISSTICWVSGSAFYLISSFLCMTDFKVKRLLFYT